MPAVRRWTLSGVTAIALCLPSFAVGEQSRRTTQEASAQLPSALKVAPAQRLWLARFFAGENGEYGPHLADAMKVCGPSPKNEGSAHDTWAECMAKNVKPARYRIADLHSAPTERSPVIATIFEELAFGDYNNSYLSATWSLELTAKPGVRLPWPRAGEMAHDYGYNLAGVQRSGRWIRPLFDLPADGWLRITPENSSVTPRVYIRVEAVEGSIVDLLDLSASGLDGKQTRIAAGSYLIQRVQGGYVQFRAEIPSDFPCGEAVIDPIPLPPTLKAPASAFFGRDGQALFAETYTKGC